MQPSLGHSFAIMITITSPITSQLLFANFFTERRNPEKGSSSNFPINVDDDIDDKFDDRCVEADLDFPNLRVVAHELPVRNQLLAQFEREVGDFVKLNACT